MRIASRLARRALCVGAGPRFCRCATPAILDQSDGNVGLTLDSSREEVADGGHAAIAVYERVREAGRGSKQRYFADVERLMPFAMGVVTVLVMLMFAGLYLDISQPL